MSNLNDFNREAKAALWVALQWLLLAVPTGLVCGAVGTAFHLSVEYVTELRAAQSWLLLCLPLAGLAIVALYKVTKCEGVGTNNVIRAVQSGEPVSPLLVPAIFLGTVLTHLCGGSAGREGAALQMGGSIGWNVGKLLHLSDYVRRTATISGMAAFFSALFGTPLTAALFAMMVEDVGLTFTSAFMPAFTSALIAYGVSLFFGIAPTNFVLNSIPHLTLETALQTALLGIACAAVTRLFCWTLHTLEHGIPKRIPNPWLRAFAGGAAVVAFSYLFGVGRYNGAGMAVIADAVEQGTALPWDFLCKIFLTALTLAVGFKGGEVVPSFYIGATFGCVAGPLLGLPAGFAGAIGLVCVFCGATNALIPSILLGFELFGGQGLELIALGCGVCYMLSGHHGLYSSQTFVTNKLRPEYASHKWRVKLKKKEERFFADFRRGELDFLPPSCYNQRSFILTKAMMRTNRSSFPMTQRGLPRIPGAASSLPCIGLLPPQSAEENLCRVRPLQHSEWRVLKGTQFGWNRGTREIFRRFIP